ncbi:hypothetical protein AB5I41_21440 [Sphingomonas sp. MMS24-JH45]
MDALIGRNVGGAGGRDGCALRSVEPDRGLRAGPARRGGGLPGRFARVRSPHHGGLIADARLFP